MKEMDYLQKAEDALVEMQQELDKARSKHDSLQEEISSKRKEGVGGLLDRRFRIRDRSRIRVGIFGELAKKPRNVSCNHSIQYFAIPQ